MAVPNAKDRPLNKEIVLSLNAQVCGSKLPKTLKNNNKQNQREIGKPFNSSGSYFLTKKTCIFYYFLVKGVLGDYEVIQECVDPCKGHRVKQRVCKQPDTFSGKPSCYTCPQDYDDTIKEACNAPGCRSSKLTRQQAEFPKKILW